MKRVTKSRTQVKICGVTTLADALLCAEAGADLLGLNFYPPSPRAVTPDAARRITDGLRAALGDCCPLLVGVFVNMDPGEIRRIMASAGLDAAQLSGDEPGEALVALAGRGFKAIRPRTLAEAADLAARYGVNAPGDPRVPGLLVDAYHKHLYGGTGEQAGVEIVQAVQVHAPRLMLAGGLTPENVAGRVRAIRPWGVDVASGVETGQPGIKDQDRVRAFIAAVRSAEERTMAFTIDTLQPSDWPQVEAIYRQGIATGIATLEPDPPPWETWDAGHLKPCRFVARNGDHVLGWAALTPVSGRCVYAGVAEVSVYIAETARGQGIGTALLTALVTASEQAGLWTLQAGIIRENEASIALHEKCGFRVVGVRERLGQLHGVWKDVVLMERRSTIVGV